jgi:hypothetical protein
MFSLLQIVQRIVGRFLNLKSIEDPKIRQLLQNQVEVRLATKMTAVFTKALAVAMETSMEPVIQPGKKRPFLLDKPGANVEEVRQTMSLVGSTN